MCILQIWSLGRKWFSSPENTEDCHLMLPIRLVFCQSHLLNQSPVLGDRICDPDHHHQVQKKKFLDDSRHCDLKHGKKHRILQYYKFFFCSERVFLNFFWCKIGFIIFLQILKLQKMCIWNCQNCIFDCPYCIFSVF